MMKNLTIFEVAGRAMSAQQVRLNTVASNLANAQSISSSPETSYRAMRPVFEAEYAAFQQNTGVATVGAVSVERSMAPPEKRYSPSHPLADKDGYIYATNVDTNEEMVEMMEAARQYQNNIEVIATAKSLMLKTLSVGK
jgi:flagellar basal-body rod protein FlgC